MSALLNLWRENIERKLRELLKPFEPKILYDAMSYYLFQEGKRIRPLLLCAVCHALGGDVEDAVTVGCAVEMIHNYSLIHDDLPILDDDKFRRGKPTCHVVFGEDIALLAGDALLTYAFEVLSNPENFRTLSEGELLFLVRELAVKSGYKGMVGGQVLDVKKFSDNKEISLKKTAQLFSFCFLAGGVIAKKWELLSSLENAGLGFGLFFQMVDDYKDKDGFYCVYGEALNYEIQQLKKELTHSLESSGIYTQEVRHILTMIY